MYVWVFGCLYFFALLCVLKGFEFYPSAGFKQPAGRIVLLCHFTLLFFFVLNSQLPRIKKKTHKKPKKKTLFQNELLLKKGFT